MKKTLEKILARYAGEEPDLIPILQDIQEKFNYLPEPLIRYLSRRLNIPLSRIYSLATFYTAFSLKPRGKNLITVCLGTACHVRGAPAILAELERRLGISAGETTKDRKYTLETVNCLGCCAIGPIVVINGKYFGEMSVKKVGEILR
ncbi:NAD(P)H-dependent oxidoreductase subunit E [candidate division WOR-3 bacterium]|uniref:NAD(P)H-dependent oxidoreductase subunit E n=1 Tax=candidate division WOR-3 bacterium TaxID=2052148 RepID=A0A660SK48_UNCW3|nr:MAG: NAD(P)H-dependent oxidoreductase subunit E [candidate division WOR-3 bacterium]